jgi:hypothetical protein
MNVDPVVPEARAIVEKAASVYIHHTHQSFVGLIVHGSALKGGFIPGCSDIDMQLYVTPDVFAEGHLPFELTVAIHRDLARIDPAPFRYIQCYAFSMHMPAGWAAPVPGAYHLIAGRLPVPEATGEELLESARRALDALAPPPSYLFDGLLAHGEPHLATRARRICSDVWPVLFQLVIVHGMDPIAAWCLTKEQAMDALPANGEAGAAIRAFHEALLHCYPAEDSVDAALDVLVRGVAFLRAAKTAASAADAATR